MAVKATRINFNTITVRGFREDATAAEVKAASVKYARWLQRQISNLFEAQRSVAGKLARNSTAYNAFKSRHGFDPRRGHKSGKLQSALKNRKLYNVKAKSDRAIITVHESRLRSIVFHAKFYEDKKVRNDELMGFQKQWTKVAPRFYKRLQPVKSSKASKRRAA